MSQVSKSSPFRQGAMNGIVFFPILAPFSMMFGVFASDVGITLFETLGYSVLVFAGASQFASLALIADHAPILIAILAGVTLNLRFVLYSAALGPYLKGLPLGRRLALAYSLVDQSFVLSDTKFSEKPDWDIWQKSSYYFGIMAVIALPWHLFTLLGYWSGALIPPEYDISFALPLAFIALIIPALKTIPHMIAALISVVGALLLSSIPYNLGLMIAAFVAIIVAAQLESYLKRHANE